MAIAPKTVAAPVAAPAAPAFTVEAVSFSVVDNTDEPAEDVREVEVEVAEIGALTVETYR